MTETQNLSIVSVKEVTRLTSLSRTMITKLRKEGKFPPAVALGYKRVGFLRHEIDLWIRDRADHARVR